MSIKARYKVTGYTEHAKFVDGSPVIDGQELMLFPETAICYPFLVRIDPETKLAEVPPNPGAMEAIKPKITLPRTRPGGGLNIGASGMVTAADKGSQGT